MPHSSGGGSHSGGTHGGSHSGHSHGSNAVRYSKQPFYNARKFRYYDKNGTERYIYSNRAPVKTSLFQLIVNLIFFIPFLGAGIFLILQSLNFFMPLKPLDPTYEKEDVHIMDTIDVIEDKDSLEKVLQEFENLTGIAPYIVTVYDSEWKQFDNNTLEDYAYYMYVNNFGENEQHFLVVYSEPENAESMSYVDWSFEGMQGYETDSILTESKVEILRNDFYGNLLQESDVGKAFESAFEKSLTYIMENNDDGSGKMMIFFAIFWNFFIIISIVSLIKSYQMNNRDYQEVPMENSANVGSVSPAYGNNAAGTIEYGNNTSFQNSSTLQGNTSYQKSQIYQSNTSNLRKYMYYDANGNKKYITCSGQPKYKALILMIFVLLFIAPLFFITALSLISIIMMYMTAEDANIKSSFIPFIIGVSIAAVIEITAIILVVRYYINAKNRQYIDVTKEDSTIYDTNIQNNDAAQYNAGTQNNNAGTQYNARMQYSGAQYNTGSSQYGASGTADSDYFNDDARFRGPEYYDDDARYRGSTAYEAVKK